MKKKISKQDIKSPDAFISFADRVGKALAENIKPILIVVGLALVIGVGLVVKRQLDLAAERAAQADIYQIEREIEEIQRQVEEKRAAEEAERLEKITEKASNEKPKPSEIKVDYEKDIAPLATQLEGVIRQYEGTRSAAVAKVNLAAIYLQHERYELAKNLLDPLIGVLDADSSLYGLARMQLASALSYLDQVDKSVTLLKEVLGRMELDYLHAEALLKMGILYQQMGDYDQARDMYRRAETEFGNTESGKSAKNYLRLLNLKFPKAQQENPKEVSELNVDTE